MQTTFIANNYDLSVGADFNTSASSTATTSASSTADAAPATADAEFAAATADDDFATYVSSAATTSASSAATSSAPTVPLRARHPATANTVWTVQVPLLDACCMHELWCGHLDSASR